MLSADRLERINGHVPTVEYNQATGLYRAFSECDCGRVVLTCYGGASAVETKALESLRDQVLREHGVIAVDRAGWHCEKCGGISGLSAHHKVFRSHGRDDRLTNLQALCALCHQAAHGTANFHRVDLS